MPLETQYGTKIHNVCVYPFTSHTPLAEQWRKVTSYCRRGCRGNTVGAVGGTCVRATWVVTNTRVDVECQTGGTHVHSGNPATDGLSEVSAASR